MTTTETALPADVQEKLSKLEAYEQQQLEAKGQFEQLSKRAAEKHAKELEQRDGQIKALTSDMVKHHAITAIREEGGDVDALLPHVLPRLSLTNTGSGFEVVGADPSGASVSAKDLVANLRSQGALGRLFGDQTEMKSTPFTRGARIVKLSESEAKNVRVYAALKERKQKGEIDGAIDHHGRKIV